MRPACLTCLISSGTTPSFLLHTETHKAAIVLLPNPQANAVFLIFLLLLMLDSSARSAFPLHPFRGKLQFSLELCLDITSSRKPPLNPISPPELDALSQTHHNALTTLNHDHLIHVCLSLPRAVSSLRTRAVPFIFVSPVPSTELAEWPKTSHRGWTAVTVLSTKFKCLVY